jgi:hypothetical protein
VSLTSNLKINEKDELELVATERRLRRSISILSSCRGLIVACMDGITKTSTGFEIALL